MYEYEDVIEILIEDIWHKPGPNDAVLREIRYLQDLYPASRGTQERGMLNLLVDRLDPTAQCSGKRGCIVSWHNCVFRLLYAVYGIDFIAFLFNHRRWAPRLTIESFQPQLFLERLSVLERAAKKLRHEEYIPVELPETKPYLKRGMGPKLNCFIENDHRILLDSSLGELRAFGKLGVSMLPKYKNIRVEINMPMRINVGRRIRTKKA